MGGPIVAISWVMPSLASENLEGGGQITTVGRIKIMEAVQYFIRLYCCKRSFRIDFVKKKGQREYFNQS